MSEDPVGTATLPPGPDRAMREFERLSIILVRFSPRPDFILMQSCEASMHVVRALAVTSVSVYGNYLLHSNFCRKGP